MRNRNEVIVFCVMTSLSGCYEITIICFLMSKNKNFNHINTIFCYGVIASLVFETNAYSEPCHTSKMERFAKTVNGLKASIYGENMQKENLMLVQCFGKVM